MGVSRRSGLTHTGLTTTRRQAETKPRVITRATGFSPPSTLGIYNGDIDTLECALLERMYYCKVGEGFQEAPTVDDCTVNTTLSKFADRLKAILPRRTPISLDDFVEMYKGPKKALYQRAVDSLRERPVCRKDATSICFTKCEKANVSKAPRVIQPRDPRYNAALGVYVKPIEHRVYRAIQRSMGKTSPVVLKGYNLDQQGAIIADKWNGFANPIAIGLDATKFDMHVGASMLRWEHGVYKHVYGNDAHLAKLLTWQVENRGKGFAPDGKLSYRVLGKRFSGDMNTALGNCLIMCAMVATYCELRGIKYDLANNGDDCVVFMDARDEAAFRLGLMEWFLELGFRMTVEPTARVLERVDFCQMRPVSVNGKWRLVRIPRVALEKDSMCTKRLIKPTDYFSWLAGVAECGIAACSGVPVMQAYYTQAYALGSPSQHLREDSGMRHLVRGMAQEATQVSSSTRYSFFLAFGILPEYQIAMEAELCDVRISPELQHFSGALWPLDDSISELQTIING